MSLCGARGEAPAPSLGDPGALLVLYTFPLLPLSHRELFYPSISFVFFGVVLFCLVFGVVSAPMPPLWAFTLNRTDYSCQELPEPRSYVR